jgi:hypothetical protein
VAIYWKSTLFSNETLLPIAAALEKHEWWIFQISETGIMPMVNRNAAKTKESTFVLTITGTGLRDYRYPAIPFFLKGENEPLFVFG